MLFPVAQTLVYAESQCRLKSALLRLNHGHGAAGFLDFFARAFCEAMRRDAKRLRQLAVAEYNYIVFGLLDEPAVMQKLGSHFFVSLKTAIESRQAYFQPAFLENVREAAFGQASMQRHLAAFETDLGGVA